MPAFCLTVDYAFPVLKARSCICQSLFPCYSWRNCSVLPLDRFCLYAHEFLHCLCRCLLQILVSVMRTTELPSRRPLSTFHPGCWTVFVCQQRYGISSVTMAAHCYLVKPRKGASSLFPRAWSSFSYSYLTDWTQCHHRRAHNQCYPRQAHNQTV